MKRQTKMADKSAIVTLDECRKMANADFHRCEGNEVPPAKTAEKYFLANQAAYYTLCNTWFLQMDEYAPREIWGDILFACQIHGLFYMIEVASDLSDRIIAELCDIKVEDSVNTGLRVRQVCNQSVWLGIVNCILGEEGYTQVTDLLQILRFPKRFSPQRLNSLEEVCTREFLDVLNYDRNRSLHDDHYYLSCRMRGIISEFFPYCDEIISSLCKGKSCTFKSNNDGKWYTFRPEDYVGAFSPGTTAETKADPLAKASWMFRLSGTYRGMPYPEARVPYMVETHMPWDPSNPFLINSGVLDNKMYGDVRHYGYACYQAVPKNFKKARGIAAEEVYRQFAAKGFADLLYDIFSRLSYFSPCYRRDDQTDQQYWVGIGSATGNAGSIDLSSASDTVLWTQVVSWFPQSIVRVMNKLRSRYVYTPDGKFRLTHMAFTSGHTLTFITESMVFGAIMELAFEMSQIGDAKDGIEYPPVCIPDGRQNSQCTMWGVYGDDCRICAPAYDTAIELLTLFGFKVNQTKSFLGRYTEACGGEFLDGKDISSSYWPRKPLLGLRDEMSPASLISLVDLQHRLFRFRKVAHFLSWYVRDFIPDVTFSQAGSDSTDLWSGTESLYQEDSEWAASQPAWKDTSYCPVCSVHTRAGIKSEKRPIEDKKFYPCPVMERIPYESRIRKDIWKIPVQEARRMLDFLAYVDFLLDGPVYATELDRLLGVSVKRDRYKALKLETANFVKEISPL